MRSIFFLCIISFVFGDLYMHNPRGNNNRLNEKSANRKNGNRLFDSQNNNRGGYNVADLHRTNGFNKYAPEGTPASPTQAEDNSAGNKILYDYADRTWTKQNQGQVQYEEVFLAGSEMNLSWTNQHGCGNPKNNCNLVMQWTCDTHHQDDQGAIKETDPAKQRVVSGVLYPFDGLRVQLKAGLNTNTPQSTANPQQVVGTYETNHQNNVGRHESEEFYLFAKNRERNKGLFTADQKVQGNKQINTRQNPGGTRRGLEIPEERDYYPWWDPTPWKTGAIFHNDLKECEEKMLKHDPAFEKREQCVPSPAEGWANSMNTNKLAKILASKTSASCTTNGGVWRVYVHPTGPNAPPKPVCVLNKWSQVNNLGNVAGDGEGGLPRNYDWQIPTALQLESAGCYKYKEDSYLVKPYFRLAIRLRYNMTTADYDPYKTFASCNNQKKSKKQSPVQQNPTVDVGVMMQGLRLAINTAQTGRTFQDRTHPFKVMDVPDTIKATVGANKIKNLNVQGKRGNIVQTFPAVEYDFWPKKQNLKVGECVNYAWVGSNTHNNGNPAGDGQAGDAGEGRGGSDRHNLIQALKKDRSFPVPLDKPQFAADFFTTNQCFETLTGKRINSGTSNNVNEKDVQMYLMSGGFYTSVAKNNDSQSFMNLVTTNDQNNGDNQNRLNELLNNTPASLRPITCCPYQKGSWVFTNTRNNNFTNRDQKHVITVT